MQYTTWLKWGIVGGLCLVLVVPFIVADGTHFPLDMFFPYITGKNFAFRIIVELLLGLYVLLAIREPKYRPRASNLMWAFGAFTLWMAIATIFSVDPIKSFWSNFERMDGYITLIHMFVLFVIAGAVLQAEKWWEKFFQISIAASMLQGIYGLFQVFNLLGFAPSSQSGARADGTFGNATYLAVYMLFNIFITLFLLIRERKARFAWWFYGSALLLQGVVLYYTQTRGTLLGFLGGLMIAALYITLFAKGTEWKRVRRYALYGLGGIALLVVGFLAVKNTSFVKNSETLSRFASISLVDRTTQSRFLIWGEAFKGIQEKPILGWGQENFSFVFNKYYNPGMYDQEQWFDRAHNEFIDWAIAGGVPAFLFYISLFILAIWGLWRSELEVPEQAVFVGLLAGYAFNNLLVFDNVVSFIYFFLILAFVHSFSRKELPSFMFLSKPLGDKTIAVAAPIVLVLMVWGIWFFNGPGLARAQGLIDALTSVDQATGAPKIPAETLDTFAVVLNEGPLGYQETVEQLFQFSSNNIAPSTSVSPDIKQRAFTFTQEAANKLLAERPGDARLELFYAVFFSQFGQYPQALAHLNAALKDSPNKQQILFEIGQVDIASGDSKAALVALKSAFDLAPSYAQARMLYAAGLYYNGLNSDADALLTQGFGTVLVDDQTLMQVYFNTKQYGRLADIYAMRLSKNPNDAQTLIAHAITLYLATGNKAPAIAELEKAATADSSLAPETQSFIDQINKGTLKP